MGIKAWRQRRRWPLPATVGLAGWLLLWRQPSAVLPVLSAIPVIIHLTLFWIFARTLRAGQTPLITRIALYMHDAHTPELLNYTRAVTQAWCVFFAAMAVVSALLAAFAPPVVWSAFTNGISYSLIALMFVAEYLIRVLILPTDQRIPLSKFLRGLLRIRLNAVAQVRRHG